MNKKSSFKENLLNPAPFIDHTLLLPTSTIRDIKKICDEAIKYGFASVCVPPIFVPEARKFLQGSPVKVTTVIGFPLGFQLSSVKLYEAMKAVEQGAQELDMVVNLSWVKEGLWNLVIKEIEDVMNNLPKTVIKVILECFYLSIQEKETLASHMVQIGVPFLKTSTGFAPQGASLEDVKLLLRVSQGRTKVKAAGGIRTLEEALAFIKVGASRIGTSSGVKIMEEFRALKTKPDSEWLEIFIDGSCLGNPGPGGYAIIIKEKGNKRVISGGEPYTTNNRMELMAAIKALSAFSSPKKIKIYTDSRYLKEGMTKWLPRWQKNGFRTSLGKPVKNQDLWQKLSHLVNLHQIKWYWIPAHTGHPENEFCDKLAKKEALKFKEKRI